MTAEPRVPPAYLALRRWLPVLLCAAAGSLLAEKGAPWWTVGLAAATTALYLKDALAGR